MVADSPFRIRIIEDEGEGGLGEIKILSCAVDLGVVFLGAADRGCSLGRVYVVEFDILCSGYRRTESTVAVILDYNRDLVYGIIVCDTVDLLAAVLLFYLICISAGNGECKSFKLEFTVCIVCCGFDGFVLAVCRLDKVEAEITCRESLSVKDLGSADSDF